MLRAKNGLDNGVHFSLLLGKPSIGQPGETQAVDFRVGFRGAHVVLLQPVHPREQRLYVRAVLFRQAARRAGILFVLGVLVYV